MIGGTIAQTADASGRMAISKSLDDLLDNVNTDQYIARYSLEARSGAHLTVDSIGDVVTTIANYKTRYGGFVVISGTDSMEELAYFLDLTLQIQQPVVITGAMKPADVIGYDGIANLSQAIQVAGDEEARDRGVLVVLNHTIHLARFVRKTDTQSMEAFQSFPGPVGQLRSGRIIFYYPNSRNSLQYRVDDFGQIKSNIPILVFGFGMPFPQSILQESAGLIIAGMGTSSLSNDWIDTLSPEWTSRLPIVLVSRCMQGINFDDHYYRGSLSKYEDRGFLLSDFSDLNPMQARIKLMLDISTDNVHRLT